MLPHPVALWKHILCRILGAAIGLLALACAIYMLAGCSAASFDVAEAKQGETAGEDGGADSGAPGDDSGATTDTGAAESGNDGGCTLYAHHGPVAGTAQDWHSCTPQGIPGDPSTYSKALADEQFAHARATSVHGWTWSDPVDIFCNGDSPTASTSGEACETTTLATTSGPVIVTWCWGGSLAGTSIESETGQQCPTLPASASWW